MILKTLASYIRKLKDRSGNYVLPAVRAKGVYLDNNTTLQSWIDDLLDTIYPVGAIYQSMNTTSPASLFGGSWNQINGVFLLSNSNSYQVNTTGGSETVTLEIMHMPRHTHNVSWSYRNGDVINQTYNGFVLSESIGEKTGPNISVKETGDSLPHNNMPPYLVCCIWRRIS